MNASTGADSFLRFDRVCRRFARHSSPVLQNASFELFEGEVALLVGPSGSGKSTLLSLAACLDRPDSGSITASGLPLYRLAESKRAQWRARHVGLVFQHHYLPAGFKVMEAVAMPLLWSRNLTPARAERIAREWVDRVGLLEFVKSKVEHLSGGQRQRVALARALAGEPSLILADEPTAQLDRETGRQIAELLRDHSRSSGATLLVVSHEHDTADWGADVKMELVDGKLAVCA